MSECEGEAVGGVAGRCSLATGWLVVWPYNGNAVIEIEPLRQSILTAYKKKKMKGEGGGGGEGGAEGGGGVGGGG